MKDNEGCQTMGVEHHYLDGCLALGPNCIGRFSLLYVNRQLMHETAFRLQIEPVYVYGFARLEFLLSRITSLHLRNVPWEIRLTPSLKYVHEWNDVTDHPEVADQSSRMAKFRRRAFHTGQKVLVNVATGKVTDTRTFLADGFAPLRGHVLPITIRPIRSGRLRKRRIAEQKDRKRLIKRHLKMAAVVIDRDDDDSF